MTPNPYPVRVQGRLEPGLSRGLWLIKWLLLIPHLIVLAFLWLTFSVLTVVAFFAILFTGSYPHGIFGFNLGVLRWSWRVAFYGYGALGTDRYPPFTLADVEDYPARLDVEYPEQLSRGLVLVKWWLLAIPHYLVLAFFVGGGVSIATSNGSNAAVTVAGGLVGLLVFFAGIALLFANRYPGGIFDLVTGMDRWALRVTAYTALMTDAYPPFRLDQGGTEPRPVPPAPLPEGTTAATGAPPEAEPVTTPAPAPPSTGRVVMLAIGSVLALVGLGLLGTGGTALAADTAVRDGAGFLMSGPVRVASSGYALRSEPLVLASGPSDPSGLARFLGDVRIHARSATDRPLFVGIAPAAQAAAYLRGVGQGVLRTDTTAGVYVDPYLGAAPPAAPTARQFWGASATGTGDLTLTWTPTAGDWVVVIMNADGSAPVAVEGSVGATVPALRGIAIGLLVGGGLLLIAGIWLIAAGARPVDRSTAAPVGAGVPA